MWATGYTLETWKTSKTVHIDKGRPHHWVTPSSGEGGQMGSSRHHFPVTPSFPNLSTQLDILILSGSNGALGFRIGAVGRRKCRKDRMSG